MQNKNKKKKKKKESGGMECAFENPSTVFLPTLTYAPVRTRIGEAKRDRRWRMRLALLVSPKRLRSLSLSLSVFDAFSEHNKQRSRLVICFHTFAGICQSTPLSPPSAASRSFFFFLSLSLLFGFFRFLTFDSGAHERFANRIEETGNVSSFERKIL